jgi:hypothetical protein
VDALEVARVVSEVASGFFYRWKFPNVPRGDDGKPTAEAVRAILLWFERRKFWRCELRAKIKESEEYLDSEKLCTDAAVRFCTHYQGELPVWRAETFLPWVEVKDRALGIDMTHETEAIWVDDYLARDAAAWATDVRGVVWVKHVTFGRRVAELGGIPFHGGGLGAETRILAEKGDRSIVASIDSHGRGRDGLQYLYNEQLLTMPPGNGKMSEQVLARLHRVGQPKSCVNTAVYRHVPELAALIEQAMGRAEFATVTWGAEQKLLTANCAFRRGLDFV